jgi:hypothetical protein
MDKASELEKGLFSQGQGRPDFHELFRILAGSESAEQVVCRGKFNVKIRIFLDLFTEFLMQSVGQS